MKLQNGSQTLADFVKDKVKAVLVDIEGTTTPIVFVTEVLFPYVKNNIESYLQKNWDKTEVLEDVDALRALSKEDIESGNQDAPKILDEAEDGVLESVVKNVQWQMSFDRKTAALKQLQGHMWRSAYEDGSIKGEVYDDVDVVLKRLKYDGKKLYVYSSGSVGAQKLLFGHSDKGDLCPLFSGYFDTKIGQKRESKSYETIAKTLNFNPEEILFLTDIYAEAKAAKEAKMNACILLRPGNKPLSKDELDEFTTIKNFHDLVSDEPSKKQRKLSEEKD